LNEWRWWLADPVFRDPNTSRDSPWRRRVPVVAAAFFRDMAASGACRKRLAALLAVWQGSAPGGLAVLAEDDEFFGQALRIFLDEQSRARTGSADDWRGK